MGKEQVLNALGEPIKDIVLDSSGKPIILNQLEQRIANYLQRQMKEKFGNALGYEVNITTLTTIMKKITTQKFFEVAPADYVPVRVGEGAWSSNLVTYRSFNLSDDFSTGVIDTGANNARLATGDAGVDSLTVQVKNWAKSIGWSIFDLELAAKSGNWDLVTAKEGARKKNWDLGVQQVAFLGLKGDTTNVLGLLTQSGITTNITRITAPISGLSAADLSTFLRNVLNDYRVNCNSTAWPTHFVIPESDYLGLATPSSSSFPLKSILQLMLETLITMTGNKNFKILPSRYCDATYNANFINGSTGKQVYALYNYDEMSLRMDLPVDYTNTLANSIDNFSFQNVGYGQFTGVLAYRPLEMLYYQY